jgi:hypothetical protein
MSMASIVKRMRSIHKIDDRKISQFPDVSLRTPSASNFDNDEGGCLLSAVLQYSQDYPLRKVVLVTSQATLGYYRLLDLVPSWNDRCGIEEIHYPLQTQQDTVMADNDWVQTIDPATGDQILRFQGGGYPQNGYNSSSYPGGSFAMWYMGPQIFNISTNECSIPVSHEEAVSQLAASLYLEIAAVVAAQFGDKQLIENKDMGGLADRLQARADKAKDRYDKLIAKDAVSFQPTFVNWNISGSLGNLDFHPHSMQNQRG